MIEYAKGRQDWYEDQREKRLSLAISMIALSGIVMGLILASADPDGIDPNSFVYRAAAGLLFLICGTAFSVIAIFLRGQNLTYTHRQDINSIFSWYNYAVPVSPRIGFFEYLIWGQNSPLIISGRLDRAREAKKNQLIEGFQDFSDKTTSAWQCEVDRYNEDLQQVFILQIFQVIARENLQMMTFSLQVGILLIGTLILALSGYIAIVGLPI